MFQFNFNNDAEVTDDKQTTKNVIEAEPVASKYDECIEVIPSNEQIESTEHSSVDSIIEKLSEESDDISCAEQNHSDVVPGVYEGGAKVWECTQDLGNFLTTAKENEIDLVTEFADKNVLDLGCGAGILGILALKSGATVHFQDYNKTVLQHITIPNILLNTFETDPCALDRCKFYSGDWQNYITTTETDDVKFDLILTSETIYNPNNYRKVINVIKSKLKSNGICFLAAKSHYFGVGGSLRQFEIALENDGAFQWKSVFLCNENVSREIIKITFISK